ncbi:GntR family transcriptional regulator [Williamsia muralis]|uniref:GntR family transcriptional regulator n=1 Tax=Williamsia marianensis TaxID=85044 RepID=A0ABU4EVF7_WILMA|nr:GntR family transcriptional regulator [Williamsia muralis]MDV7135238.1 GntR family transcriptional regulator [Williamsia muralis]
MTGRKRDAEPAYQALARQLRRDISSGNYDNGIRLPTESELSDRYEVSRQTVRRAFVDLVAAGIVYRVPGRGTFVNDAGGRYLRQQGSIEDLLNLSTDTTMEVMSALQRRVDVEAAGRLRLDSDVVYSVVFRRFHENVPFVLTTVHLPEDTARLILDAPEMATGAISTYTVIGLLGPHLPSPISEAAQSITVDTADSSDVAHLGCRPGHPVLRIDRLYSDDADAIRELSVSHYLPEQYTYRVTLHRA